MTEPVTLAEAKTYLRWISTGDATLDADAESDINALIQSAREQCEHHTGRAFPDQVVTFTFRSFPSARDYIELPLSPARSITSVAYIDTSGNSQTWAAANYTLNVAHQVSRLCRAYDVDWPETRDQAAAVTVVYAGGYATPSTVPAIIKTAVKMTVNDWFENRATIQIGSSVNQLPNRAADILEQWRIYRTYHQLEEAFTTASP